MFKSKPSSDTYVTPKPKKLRVEKLLNFQNVIADDKVAIVVDIYNDSIAKQQELPAQYAENNAFVSDIQQLGDDKISVTFDSEVTVVFPANHELLFYGAMNSLGEIRFANKFALPLQKVEVVISGVATFIPHYYKEMRRRKEYREFERKLESNKRLQAYDSK